jgi:predicted amidophosphoribosyltransferase
MLKADASRHAKDISSARLWLAHAVPLADVLTMLEVHRRFDLSPALARTYAVEILWAVQHSEDTLINHPLPTTKEIHYAAA